MAEKNVGIEHLNENSLLANQSSNKKNETLSVIQNVWLYAVSIEVRNEKRFFVMFLRVWETRSIYHACGGQNGKQQTYVCLRNDNN